MAAGERAASSGEAAGATGRRRRLRALVEVLATGLLPGLLAGGLLAGLLFFLNPELPFGLAPLARVGLYYGLLLGLASLLLLVVLSFGRRRRLRRMLPWSLTVALALGAGLAWAHASYLTYYLPPGINIRLIKAAAWLSLAALIAFYTALLHSLHARPYGWKSRALLGFLVVASLYAVVERREAFQSGPGPSPLPSGVEAGPRPRLWVVGLEGATLDVILPLAERGELRFFAELLEQGVYARMASLSPSRRAPLWTTLATGKLPHRHGVLADRAYPAGSLAPGAELTLLPVGIGFERWGLPDGGGRPVDSAETRHLALWEILDRVGFAGGVIGWPGSRSVPPGLAFALSEAALDTTGPTGAGYPRREVERARRLRATSLELATPATWQLGLEMAAADLEAWAIDAGRASLAARLCREHPGAAGFVVLPGLGEVSRRYLADFSAVHFEGSRDPETQRRAERLIAYYRFLDDFLADFWEQLEGPRVLAVVSAEGGEAEPTWRALWERLRERRIPVPRPPDGVLLLRGEGFREGRFLTEAHLADLAPTLLYALGLPVARDLDGRVLTGAFDSAHLARHPLIFLPSYETLEVPSRLD